MIGLQCQKYLWIIFHEPEKIPKATIAEEFKFEQGTNVGQFAKKLFPKGIDLQTKDYLKNIEDTKNALKEKKPLFEAGFEFNNCFSRADILVPVKDGWDIIEVKSGTEVKDENIHDVSFQKYVYENSGLKIRKCFLMHLNKEYRRKGEINLKELFVKEDITSKVDKVIEGIKERISCMFDIINSKKCPETSIGKQCKYPYECPICGCWECLPENHVFCLYRGGKLCYELYDKGVELIKDIPEEIKLNDKQGIQRDCEVNKKIYINKEKIKQFLKTLKYPIYFLDFETFSTAIPMFDGLKPYSQVPFQFSLHVVKKDKPEHYAFLYNGKGDPREEFILDLKKVLGEKGTVLVYNQVFEIGRLKELAEHFPKHKKWVDGVLKRVIDLLIPFREFNYYNPKQQGSASIKNVLPAIVGKSYKGMEIADGGTASTEFFKATYENYSEEKRKKVLENLLKYCELDTLAEVLIVEKLKELIL